MSDETNDIVEVRGDTDNPGLTDVFIAGHPAGALLEKAIERSREAAELREEVDALRAEVESLQMDVATARAPDGGEQLTKQSLAEQLTMQECIRVADQSPAGGRADVDTITSMAERQYAEDLHPESVRRAWKRLEREWDGFTIHQGEPGPHTPNKHIKLEGDRITKSLRLAAQGRSEDDDS